MNQVGSTEQAEAMPASTFAIWMESFREETHFQLRSLT